MLKIHLTETYGAPSGISRRPEFLHRGPHSVSSYLDAVMERGAGGDMLLLCVFQWITGARISLVTDRVKLYHLHSMHREIIKREPGAPVRLHGILYWTGGHFLAAGE